MPTPSTPNTLDGLMDYARQLALPNVKFDHFELGPRIMRIIVDDIDVKTQVTVDPAVDHIEYRGVRFVRIEDFGEMRIDAVWKESLTR